MATASDNSIMYHVITIYKNQISFSTTFNKDLSSNRREIFIFRIFNILRYLINTQLRNVDYRSTTLGTEVNTVKLIFLKISEI